MDRATFAASLSAEHQAYREFCEILNAEHACLLRSVVDALVQLTQLKSSKGDRLAEFSSARDAYLHSLELSPGPQGMTDWLAGCSDTQAPALSDLWRQLVDLAAKARALNESNGTLITTRMMYNHAALAALQSAARVHSLYGPDGQTSVTAGNRELGSA
jgi:flagella synthesis protein FlgN